MEAVAIIAESRILAAQARGEFDNLPGAGKPLPADEFAHVRNPETRMALRLLRNSNTQPGDLVPRGDEPVSRLRRDAEVRYSLLRDRRR